MGCTQSKIENEEAVTRCKDRKHHMKDAVAARNAFAAAHSAYSMSLKNTGAALSDYAPGESQHRPSTATAAASVAAVQPPLEDFLPPPPLPNFHPSSLPLSRAASMPQIPGLKHDPLSSSTDPILEVEDEGEIDNNEESLDGSLRRRRRSSAARNENKVNRPPSEQEIEDEDGPRPSPSPPPPPRRDRDRDRDRPTPPKQASPPPPMPSSDSSSWDFFFYENMTGPSLGMEETDEDRLRSEAMDQRRFEEKLKTTEEPATPEKQPEVRAVENDMEPPPPPPAGAVVAAPKPVVAAKKRKQAIKGGVGVNLVEVFNKLDDHFLKASESAHDVSMMLEANRLHYHSNFADNRGHIDHSARVMRVITWNRSFKALSNQDDMVDDFDSDENETHATVLDKLLAWEKKLYDEVKAGELMKFEYQKKVASLNRQKKRGTNSEALVKAKAAVSHLHTRYIVDMQSLDSTVTEINRLRDNQLYPKLVALVDGMAQMWEAMHTHHEQQTDIAAALRSLDPSQAPKETSDHHHERTIQLWGIVQEWHSQFEKLVVHQKEYIKALNSWLKLNLVPIESSFREKVSSPPRPQNPPIQSLLQAWDNYLEKLPDDAAKSAISSFAAVVNTIVQHQQEELKMRLRCKDTREELARRSRQFDDWYHKYMQRRLPPDESDAGAGDGSHDEEVVERRVALEAVKKRLEEEEAAYQRQCLQVRDKSLVSLRTRLPELFHTMSEFAEACSQIYGSLRSISRSRKPSGGAP